MIEMTGVQGHDRNLTLLLLYLHVYHSLKQITVAEITRTEHAHYIVTAESATKRGREKEPKEYRTKKNQLNIQIKQQTLMYSLTSTTEIACRACI